MIKVLYTDDEPALLEIGKVFLEQSRELQVETAISGKDAIRMLKDHAFDAIVSDYQMPGMDGIELLKYLRRKCGGLPFILFTGRGREEVIIEAINNGADFYLQKGGEPKAQFAELEHKIRQAVQRHRIEQRIVHFNRLYLVLYGVNTTIVRAKTRDELFADICRITVEEGKFTMAWIGLIDTPGRTIVPAAHIGFEDGCLQSVQIDNPLGQEPSGRAVREGTHVICNDIACEPGMESWYVRTGKRGCRSTGAFPLYIDKILVGVLQLYSVEENFFSEGEIQLLDEVASDISFALERMKAAESRVRTEASLEESEEKLAAIVAGSPVPKFVIDSDHRIMYWNRALEQATGISAEQVIGTRDQWRAFYREERPTMADLILDGAYARIHELYAGKASESSVVPGSFDVIDFFPHLGDKGKWLRFMAAPIKNDCGVTLGAVETLIDVTDIKRAEGELVTKNEELQAACEEITATEEELRANLDELTWQERALRESEERYRNIVEDQTEFICRFLPDGTHIFVNDAYCRYFGVAREVILGHRFSPVLYADDRKAVAAFFATLTPEKPVGTIDHRIIMPDGAVRWQRWSDRALFDDKGMVLEYQSVGRDITEYKEAEEAIKRSETQLTAIIQSSPIPKFVIDKDHRVIHWNKALEGYSGIKEKEIIGTNQHWRAFYPEERPCMADLLLDGSIEKISQWYAGKYAKSKLIDGAYEATDFFPHMGKTGTWLFFTASVIKDDEGNILGAVETLEDSTETHLKTEELNVAYLKTQTAFDLVKESEERYRNIVEDQTEFICRFLPDGTHVFVNDAYCRYFGVAREDILDHRFRPVLHPEDREMVAHHIASITPEHPVMDIDQRIIMPDGSIKWQRWSDRAIFGENGRVVEYQSVGRDITEQKELETEMEYHEQELLHLSTSLATVNKKLTLLSSITRHDINNLLTGIRGYLELMENKHPAPALTEYLHQVTTAAQRISAMIRFTKEYEEIGINIPAWQDCRTLVDTAAKQAPLGKVMVKNDLPAGTEVFADPLVVRVCYNLMDNAVRYGGKITTIRFSVEEYGDDHLIVCEDDGAGVVAEEKEKIFDRGFGKNTGMGLFLSREILSITGITIRENGEPGKGARFEIIMPSGCYRCIPAVVPGTVDAVVRKDNPDRGADHG